VTRSRRTLGSLFDLLEHSRPRACATASCRFRPALELCRSGVTGNEQGPSVTIPLADRATWSCRHLSSGTPAGDDGTKVGPSRVVGQIVNGHMKTGNIGLSPQSGRATI